MFLAIYHGALPWLLPILTFGGTSYISRTDAAALVALVGTCPATTFWIASCNACTVLIFVVNARLLMKCQNPWTAVAWGPTVAAFLVYLCILFLLGHTSLGHKFQPNLTHVPIGMFENSTSLLWLFVTPLLCLMPDFMEITLQPLLFPSAMDKAQRQQPQKSPMGRIWQQWSKKDTDTFSPKKSKE